MENTNNDLILRKENELSSVSNKKIFTTINLNDSSSKIMLYNSLNGCDVLLNDIVGQDIDMIDCYIEEKISEDVDNETGEVKANKKFRCIIYGQDGKSYVAGAYGIYNSLVTILSIFGNPTRENPIKVRVAKKETSVKGRESLVLNVI